MNAGSQRLKGNHLELTEVATDAPVTGAPSQEPSYHDRELLEIAAFRLRDAAQRVAALVSLTQSLAVRGELLAVCERLMDEERGFVMRAFAGTSAKPGRLPVARVMRK